jgi:Holliday junction resolvase
MEKKIDDLLFKHKTEPDGLIFEILVALSYAEKGWAVEFIEEQFTKTPDMVVKKNGKELYIECKRLIRRTEYAEQERIEFLRLWDSAKDELIGNRQWIWMKGVFHSEASSLPTDFLANIYKSNFPIDEGETLIHDDADANIYARLIDIPSVHRHLSEFRVKLNSPSFSRLLGGNWAPKTSAVTVINAIKVSHVVDCEVPALGTYVEEVGWACGFTRDFDSDVSVHKKARDILTRLANAVKQLPKDKPSIIHIAAETLEGKDVERRRTEKVMNSIKSFITDKPLLGIRFHRFQANQCVDKLYEFDETVETFQADGVDLKDIPENVVTPNDAILQDGQHWEIYS